MLTRKLNECLAYWSKVCRYSTQKQAPLDNVCQKRIQNIPLSTSKEQSVSYYRRQLPPFLTPFNSEAGRQMFKSALLNGTLENYFDLVGNFSTQVEPAYCGLGTLAMVLNTLQVDPGRVWKGVWRWYSEDMLECCEPLDRIREHGITIDQFVSIARCHGLQATLYRFDECTISDFMDALRLTSTTPGVHLVVSFSREALEQTGIGHFSPIGGLCLDSNSQDQALVLDVARFKYPSYWTPVDRLWNAMKPVDDATNRPRGFILLRKGPSLFTCP